MPAGNATRHSMAYMTISKRTHAMAGRPMTKFMASMLHCRKMVVMRAKMPRIMWPANMVAVKSDGKGKPTQHERDELEEPDDGNHHDGQTGRSDGLDIAKTALALDALPVEIVKATVASAHVTESEPWGSCPTPGMSPMTLEIRMKKKKVRMTGMNF